MVGMSHLWWPEAIAFKSVILEPEERSCAHCGRFTYVNDRKHRYLHSLGGPLHVVSKVTCCPDKGCAGHAEKLTPMAEMSLAPPFWSVSWDLFSWMGHRRMSRHWSIPQIRWELKDSFGIQVSADLIEDYTRKYEVMLAGRESDVGQLVEAYRQEADVILSIDGLQPEKGHETLYVVRELRLKRVWFAESLLSSAAPEVKRLFERARELAARIDKPVRGVMSDKQDAFVSGAREVFPDVPHRYCANHFLRDAAKPVLEADSQAKVQMRRKVRGLRDIERRVLSERAEQEMAMATDVQPPAKMVEVSVAGLDGTDARPPVKTAKDSTAGQVVLDYCAAVRGILNDDQGGPLHPPGVRMAEALAEVQASIGRAQVDEKGGSTTAHSLTLETVSSEAPHW